jgi:hypothetical protein
MSRILIAFTGLAGSGKTTAAIRLVERHSYSRVRFAGPLKAMLRELGLTDAQIEGDQKEVPCDLLCGKTPRWAMQSIGTEWGRELIGPDIWINAWRAEVDRLPPYQHVVAEDCRFPNEVEAIRAAGGVVARIERSGAGLAEAHISEQLELEACITLDNHGSKEDFLRAVDTLHNDLSWALAA